MSKVFLITSLMALMAPSVAVCLLYRRLPPRVAMQWDLDSKPTWFASRGLFICFMLLGSGCCLAATVAAWLATPLHPWMPAIESMFTVAASLLMLWAIRRNARSSG